MQGRFKISSQTEISCLLWGQDVCVSCLDLGLVGLHLDGRWEGPVLNYRVFLRSSVRYKLAGLPLGVQMDMTPGRFLGGQDCPCPVDGSLKSTFVHVCCQIIVIEQEDEQGTSCFAISILLLIIFFKTTILLYLHSHSPLSSLFLT